MVFTSDILTPPPRAARILPWLVAVAFFMQMLDATILNTALPGMALELGVEPLRMQSVVIAYMLTTALLMPVSGWLADHFGTRKIFVLAILLFSLGSLLCAIFNILELLVLSRIVQGMGGALMVPVGRLVALKAFPRHELVRVLSFITLPALIGPLMAPTLGRFLVQYASWHWIFLINLPVGFIGALLALRYMPDFAGTGASVFVGKGFLLFSSAMVLVSFAMEGFGDLHIPKVQAALLCVTGLLMLSLYWLRSTRVEAPLFSPHLFRNRSFAVGIFGNLFGRLAAGATPFLLPLFLQISLGFSPFMAGLTMIPTSLAAFIGKTLVTPLVTHLGLRNFLITNTLAQGALIMCLSLVGHTTPYPLLLCLLGAFGVANSMQFTAMNSVTLIDLSDSEASSGNSLLFVTMQISSSIGVALGAALLDGFKSAQGAPPLTDAQLLTVFH